MGAIKEPEPVKLIMPMITGHAELFDLAKQALVGRFGPVDYESLLLPFDHTDYYEAEFGPNLQRCFLSFEELIDPGRLAEIKCQTNEMEQDWGEGRKRRINLDPGYIALSKLVLATTKNHGHRIYIGRGIYAEVTLTYRDKDFRPWPWTYPDYRSEPYLRIVRAIRATYLSQLRERRSSGHS